MPRHGHGEHAGHGGHGGHARHYAHMVEDFQRRFWISLVLTVPILILSPTVQQFFRFSFRFPGDILAVFIFSSIVYLYGGMPFLRGLIAEVAERQPGMMTLIGTAITAAYAFSSLSVFLLRGGTFFWELVTLIDIMLLGHWIEMTSVSGASRALEELAALMPAKAHKLGKNGVTVDVPLDALSLGDLVLVRPGEKIPADGKAVSGESAVNEAMLTGESRPVDKKTGAGVIGGSINGEGSLTIEVDKTGKDSFLARVIELVRQAQESKSRLQNLSDKAAFWLTMIALSAGGATFLLWFFLTGQGFTFSLERTVTVMVIACPHALGLAVPLVVAISTGSAARHGFLIRNRTAFEQARKIQTVIFDKTGTLTKGEFGVTDVLPLTAEYGRHTILALAASVESHSEHAIARGIAKSSQDIFPVESFKAIPGKGVEGIVNGRNTKVVSYGYLREMGVKPGDIDPGPLYSQGKTVTCLLIDDKPVGVIALADIVRPESKEAVSELKAAGIRCMMLTGDKREVAQWVSAQVGLDEYFAEIVPGQKAAKVKEVQSRRLTVAMVGDGVNDAPALAQADVGIAIGAGTDIAIESADVVLVKNDPTDVPAIIGLSRVTYRKMIQNLLWATGYNAFAIPLAAGIFYPFGILLTPAAGAVLMSASTVIVAFNARLLGLYKGAGRRH